MVPQFANKVPPGREGKGKEHQKADDETSHSRYSFGFWTNAGRLAPPCICQKGSRQMYEFQLIVQNSTVILANFALQSLPIWLYLFPIRR
jgi:hypothetical protein